MISERMKKNGFTLIELLAVIVILSIIALISVPLILNVIDDSKKGAFKSTSYGIIEAAELEYAQSILKGNKQAVTFTYTDGVETSSVGGRTLNYKGTKPKNGTVIINSSGEIAIAIHDGKYCAEKGYDKSEVTISEKEAEECQLSEENEIPVAPNFINTYGGSVMEEFHGIVPANNGYLAVGFSSSTDVDLAGLNKGSSDATVVKYGLNGNIAWNKNYGGSSDDNFKNVIIVNDGYIVVGYSNSNDGDLADLNKGGYDGIIVKYDTNGNIVWKNNFGGSNADYFEKVSIVSNGYVAVGFSLSNDGDLAGLNKGNKDAFIIKDGNDSE